MKLIFVLVFAVTCFSIQAQTPTDTTTKVVSVSPQQSFYLDSRFVANLNGRARLAIPFCLPEGTVKYYVSFAGSDSKNEITSFIGLAGQLTRIIDRTGITAGLIDAIVKPTGTAVTDIYILDTSAHKSFLNYRDRFWSANPYTSRQNITGGVMEITPKSNCELICFNNPSLKSGLNLKFEITAIVYKTPRPQIIKSVEVTNVNAIIVAPLTDKIIPMESTLAFKTARIADSLEKAHNFDALLQHTNLYLSTNFDDTLAKILHARSLILNRKPTEATALILPLTETKNTDLNVNLILAHSYLLSNQNQKAERIYIKFKGKTFADGILWEDKVRADFKAFISYKMFNSYYGNILKKFNK